MDKVKCSECGKELVSGEQIRCVYCELNQVNGNSSLSGDTNCGICNTFTIRDKESLHCELCKRWYHNACNELALDDRYCSLVYEAPKNIKWFCDKCIWETEKWIHDNKFSSDGQRKDKTDDGKQGRNITDQENKILCSNRKPNRKRKKEIPNGTSKKAKISSVLPQTKVRQNKIKCATRHKSKVNTKCNILKKEVQQNKIKCATRHKSKVNTKCNILKKEVNCPDENDNEVSGGDVNSGQNDINDDLIVKEENYSYDSTSEGDDQEFLPGSNDSDDSSKEDTLTLTGKKVLKKKIKLNCDKCCKTFFDKQKLEAHKLWHTGDKKPFKCLECQREFTKKYKLKYHISKHSKKEIYYCNKCSKRFFDEQDFEAHKLWHTGDEACYKCLECGKGFRWKQTLGKHLLTHSNGKYHYCDKCPKRIRKSVNFEKILRDHLLTHSDENPAYEKPTPKKKIKYRCDECPKHFFDEQSFEAHKLWHIGDKMPFKCLECGKGYSNKEGLVYHSLTHSNEKCICDICGKQLKHSGNLKAHKRTHSSELPFVCEVCNRGFKHSSNLRLHMAVHNKIKDFLCPICGKGFAHKDRLYMHNKVVHSDEKPFECELCGNKYKTRHNLNQHQRGIRGTCHENNTQKQTLKSHKKSKPSSNSNTNDSYSSDSVHLSQYNEQQPPLLIYTGGNNEPVAPVYSSSHITATIHCPPPALSVFTGQYMA